MALEKIADKVIDTDVLIIGGGMAGCTAAALAKEQGLDVTLVEKSHTYRGGSAAAGLDHQIVNADFTGFFLAGVQRVAKLQRPCHVDGERDIKMRCVPEAVLQVEADGSAHFG